MARWWPVRSPPPLPGVRRTPIPRTLDAPPAAWEAQYGELAQECDLAQATMHDAFAVVAVFWQGAEHGGSV
jgi:hypothetical protein